MIRIYVLKNLLRDEIYYFSAFYCYASTRGAYERAIEKNYVMKGRISRIFKIFLIDALEEVNCFFLRLAMRC